ncbi:hypothetical protein HDU96_000537 [Phlyctochytrium bullatum]|nr:hypothetical protein HDU96_000537 [Phlyctochytrium bullatum]
MRDLYNRYCAIKEQLNSYGQHADGKTPDIATPRDFEPDTPDTPTSQNVKLLRQEKKRLQIFLHKYQDDFKKKYGKAISTAEDRAPILSEYKRYKELRDILSKAENL